MRYCLILLIFFTSCNNCQPIAEQIAHFKASQYGLKEISSYNQYPEVQSLLEELIDDLDSMRNVEGEFRKEILYLTIIESMQQLVDQYNKCEKDLHKRFLFHSLCQDVIREYEYHALFPE